MRAFAKCRDSVSAKIARGSQVQYAGFLDISANRRMQ